MLTSTLSCRRLTGLRPHQTKAVASRAQQQRRHRSCNRLVTAICCLMSVTVVGAGCVTKKPAPPPPTVIRDPDIPPPPPLTSSTPLREGVDLNALNRLVDRAERTKSSALVVMRNGKVVGSWSFDGSSVDDAMETMNITPAVVSLGIAALVDDGTLSYEDELSAFFPELKGKPAGQIRIRHIMTHTSGLPALPTSKIYQSNDVIKLVLKQKLRRKPGSRFEYNNSALNLLPEIVARKTKKSFSYLMDRRIFLPLGIKRGRWGDDDSGHLYAMSNLELSAIDLAKIGWMMAQGGVYKKRRILHRKTVQDLLRPVHRMPNVGLLWWMGYPNARREITAVGVTALEDAGFDEDIVEALRNIQEDPIPVDEFNHVIETQLGNDVHAYRDFVRKRHIKVERDIIGRPEGFQAKGSGGQSLVVFPKQRLVVVRMRRLRSGSVQRGADNMSDIFKLSSRLTK